MTNAADWIGLAVGIIGLIGVVVAVCTYLKSVKKSRSEEDVGFICCNERLMGIFTAKTPWYEISPWEKAKVPWVPTMTGFLRAGDANKWTSALVDCLPENLDDEVCWKQLYESFFVELAWYKHPYSALKDNSIELIMEGAAKLAEEAKTYSKNDTRAFNLEAQNQNEIRRYNWHCDRRLLHQKRHGQPALLQNCIRSLEKFGVEEPFNPFTGDHSIWERNLRPIWIYKSRPCLIVSMEQLAGLCLDFGVCLQNNPAGLFSGTGAFGLTIDVSPQGDSEVVKVHLTQTRRIARLQASKGNGYSLLYAKLMACGCLPFAQSQSFTKSIMVTRKIRRGIQKGRKILDAEPVAESSSIDFLGSVPSQTNDDLFYTASTEPPLQSSYGAICNNEGYPLRKDGRSPNWTQQPYWTWSKAVAGIAFGGLVPLATCKLVDCVRFTVLGADIIDFRTESASLMEVLERFINVVHGWNPNLELFGPFIARRLAMSREPNVNLHFFLKDHCGVADVAATFGRYTTLLERLIGMLPQARQSVDCTEQVYRALCEKLRKSYEDAVHTKNHEQLRDGAEAHRLVENINAIRAYVTVFEADAPPELSSIPPITTEFCAKVARIVILAWTYQVNLVHWNESNEEAEVDLVASFETYAESKSMAFLPIESMGNRIGALGL